jgi:glycosyltransferase involved in cell wall biosynthesis
MILIISSVLWKGQRQRPQHLAAGLARIEPVLFVEPMTLGQQPTLVPVQVEHNVFVVSIPTFPHNARKPWIRTLSNVLSRASFLRALMRAFQRAILRRALRQLPGQGGIRVLLHDFLCLPLAESFLPDCMVFDYIDDSFGFTRFPPYVRRTWLSTLRRADAVTVTSPTLQQIVGSAAGIEATLVTNGVEFERFASSDRPRPADLPPTGQPLVLYIGSVYPWLDFDLVKDTARACPEMQFVFIGQSHPDVGKHLAHLGSLGNFAYLGFRPYETLPAYLHSAAAAIIPFSRNPLTASVNPVKLYEQSAAGIPTVVTAFSDDLELLGGNIFIARSHADFPARLRDAIARGADPAFRHTLQSFARGHDWSIKISAIAGLLQQKTTHAHAARPQY